MISIAMTSYNGEKYIVDQLESIRAQTIPPDEVIISDDGSSDNTVKIVEDYINRYGLKGWRIVENPKNLGYIKNFWKTILSTKGDYVFLADQDDIWKQNKIESMVSIMAKTSAMMLHTEVDVINNDREVIKKAMNNLSPGIRKLNLKKYMRKSHYCGMSSVLSGKMRSLMEPLGTDCFPTHDWCLGVLSALNDGFYTCSDVYSLRRSHGDNVALNINGAERKGIPQRIDTIKRYQDLYEAADIISKQTENDRKNSKIIARFIEVSESRIESLESRSITNALKNITALSYYPSPKAWVSDMMYLCGIF